MMKNWSKCNGRTLPNSWIEKPFEGGRWEEGNKWRKGTLNLEFGDKSEEVGDDIRNNLMVPGI